MADRRGAGGAKAEGPLEMTRFLLALYSGSSVYCPRIIIHIITRLITECSSLDLLLFLNSYTPVLTISQGRKAVFHYLIVSIAPKPLSRPNLNPILHPTMAVRAQFENSNE